MSYVKHCSLVLHLNSNNIWNLMEKVYWNKWTGFIWKDKVSAVSKAWRFYVNESNIQYKEYANFHGLASPGHHIFWTSPSGLLAHSFGKPSYWFFFLVCQLLNSIDSFKQTWKQDNIGVLMTMEKNLKTQEYHIYFFTMDSLVWSVLVSNKRW